MTLSVTTTALTIKITMKSDWHVGSGLGRGELDSIVQRDADGLPYIPAKTLTGILRDACEQVALGLDDGQKRGKWHDWVNFLFGNQPVLLKRDNNEDRDQLEYAPRSAVLAIRSAHLDQNLRKALKTKPKLQNAIAFMKAGVAIDPATGTAIPDYLRFEEVVRMDAVLEAKAELNLSNFENGLSEEEQKTAHALLVAGAKMVERLGGKRRRGNGRCEMTIQPAMNPPKEQWVPWLKNNYSTIGKPPILEPKELASDGDNPDTVSPWFIVPLTIMTESPLVLPARTVGNVVECLNYIPGRYLLRHLHQSLGQLVNVSQAITDDDLILTNGTIAVGDKAGRPTPFCLFSEKLDGGLSKGKGVYNRFQEIEPNDMQLKGERSGYIGHFSGSQLPAHKNVRTEIYTHNTIEDEVQRPTSYVGGVYSYQAIPAETEFKAELRLPTSLCQLLESKDKKWWEKLNASTTIGQSKKDQYGQIKITATKPIDIKSSPVNNNTLSVWLLSDLLLRSDRLNPSFEPQDLKTTLEQELGITLKERDSKDLMSIALRSQRTESWQGRWGLPRPSLVGWQAGSCVLYEITGDISPDKLTSKLLELTATGIGDRRAEGYGQISFNDPLIEAKLSGLERTPDPDLETTPNNPVISSNHATFAYARLIEQAAWREAIQNKALAIAADPKEREDILGIRILKNEKQPSQPSMTQLGALRSVLRQLQSNSEQDKNIVKNWLTALSAVPNRKEKWDNTNKGLQKIQELITQADNVWNALKLNLDELTMTQDGKTQLKNELWAEAVRTLVDAIIRGHKRDLEKLENKEAA